VSVLMVVILTLLTVSYLRKLLQTQEGKL